MKPRKAAIWRDARDAALALWKPSGLRFKVSEGRGFPEFDKARMSELNYLGSLIIPGVLRLARSGWTWDKHPGWAWWQLDKDPGAVTVIKMGPLWHLASRKRKIARICHEVGHCLGLDHRPASNSVMTGWERPDEHDIASVRDYYLGD
jgi:hypothetical protein